MLRCRIFWSSFLGNVLCIILVDVLSGDNVVGGSSFLGKFDGGDGSSSGRGRSGSANFRGNFRGYQRRGRGGFGFGGARGDRNMDGDGFAKRGEGGDCWGYRNGAHFSWKEKGADLNGSKGSKWEPWNVTAPMKKVEGLDSWGKSSVRPFSKCGDILRDDVDSGDVYREVDIEEIEEGEVVNCLSNKGMNMCSDDVLALDSVGASYSSLSAFNGLEMSCSGKEMVFVPVLSEKVECVEGWREIWYKSLLIFCMRRAGLSLVVFCFKHGGKSILIRSCLFLLTVKLRRLLLFGMNYLAVSLVLR